MAIGPISHGQYTALRVIAATIPSIVSIAVTAALFWWIPFTSDLIQEVIREEGVEFAWIVIPPSILVVVIMTAMFTRIMWRETDPRNFDEGN